MILNVRVYAIQMLFQDWHVILFISLIGYRFLVCLYLERIPRIDKKNFIPCLTQKMIEILRKIAFRLGDQSSALGLILNHSDHSRESRDDSLKFYAVEPGSSDEKRRKYLWLDIKKFGG